MTTNTFNWQSTKQLSIPGMFLAFFLPSTFAFTGFRFVLPVIVKNGIPAILAWPSIACAMLLVLLILAIVMLKKDASDLSISVTSRMCLLKLTFKQWMITLGILVTGLIVTLVMGKASILFTKIPGLAVPDYMPFFLNPHIDPMNTDPSILTPDFTLKGAFYLIPLIALTLILNILTEELYFRAYLLPKMVKYGKSAWILNGTLFALYHTYQLWLIPQILPLSLFMAFAVYRCRSIWPAFVIHMLANMMTVVGMVFLIAA